MRVANDLGREAGCNDDDAGTGNRCHEGMREIGEVGWCYMGISRRFFFFDFQDNFCFLISGECFLSVMVSWFVAGMWFGE